MNDKGQIDQDVLLATVDLAGRTGARAFEIGWTDDNDNNSWYAHCRLKGARIFVEKQAGPVAACDALAERILTGAKCKCGKLVALSDHGAIAFPDVQMADGSTWTVEAAREAGQCHWRRQGPKWNRGCDDG